MNTQPARLQEALHTLRSWFQHKPPEEDPYAYVGAPKKPAPPHLRASALAKKPETSE